jgi:hypothetical protein
MIRLSYPRMAKARRRQTSAVAGTRFEDLIRELALTQVHYHPSVGDRQDLASSTTGTSSERSERP